MQIWRAENEPRPTSLHSHEFTTWRGEFLFLSRKKTFPRNREKGEKQAPAIYSLPYRYVDIPASNMCNILYRKQYENLCIFVNSYLINTMVPAAAYYSVSSTETES